MQLPVNFVLRQLSTDNDTPGILQKYQFLVPFAECGESARRTASGRRRPHIDRLPDDMAIFSQ